jgi:hypothetical protein
MKSWFKVAGLALLAAALGLGGYFWFRTPEWQRCYAKATGGMTLAQVREVMGRDEDPADERQTATGEFERSWTFDDGGVTLTVVFGPDGRSTYIEFGPDFCGVTPLMEKYIKK